MLIALLEQMERTMLEETKRYLSDQVISLHYQASVESKPELRKIADDLAEVLKKEQEKCYI